MKINLLDNDLFTDKNKKRITKILYPFAVLAVVFFIFMHNIIFSNESFFKYITKSFKSFVPSSNRAEEQVDDPRINVLLLGHGGLGHDGPNLTDSIHILSVNPDNNNAYIISIPRDLLVDIPDFGKQKINHTFALTEQESPGSGGLVTSQVVGKVLGIKIDYYATINFVGFIKLIDDLGGIDVNVPNGFIDKQYPDDNYLYQTVEFEKGWQIMGGDKALKFVRSRHGICTTPCKETEGTDFARAKRQQIILKAIKDKVLSSNTWTNPKNVYNILKAYNNNIQTNAGIFDIKTFYDIAKKTDTSSINNFVLDASTHGLLQATNINGAYVLIPKTGQDNFEQIQTAVKNALYPQEETKIETQETIFVEIQNGTTITGFASKVANRLEKNGIKITKVGNSNSSMKTNQETLQTIIYDFTGGKKNNVLNALQKNLPGSKISVDIPLEIIDSQKEDQLITINNTPLPTEQKTDFLIIIGSDLYANLNIGETNQ